LAPATNGAGGHTGALHVATEKYRDDTDEILQLEASQDELPKGQAEILPSGEFATLDA